MSLDETKKPMSIEEAQRVLICFNRWRRDDNVPNTYEMPDPKEVGKAIDIAIMVLGTVSGVSINV